ncbi:alpha/beta fold hydrolase [Novosphingobium sp. BL-8H]|uniref:alpha/beta fold hydrolase n=1 Tax=Novosphingobium sp. BL-8H TaxID=3127640 RepID=UPI0037568E89
MKCALGALLACCALTSPVHAQEADPYAPGRAVIADIDRIVTAQGVDETQVVTLGGTKQVVNIRGADRDNPILLFIHGGPGAVEMPIAWAFQRPWEDYFTVVQWDQRGAGRSYPLNDPEALAPTLTLDRYRDDAIELIEWLQKRYGKRKVVVLGHSWGSAVGMAVAAKRPDLLHAYVGLGQIIDFKESERRGMAWTIAEAKKRGDAKAVAAVEALRPYPDQGFSIDKADGWRQFAIPYGSLAWGRKNADFYLKAPRLSPLYTPDDVKAWGQGSEYTVTRLWPKLADVSYTKLTRMNVPVVMMIGRHDHTTDAALAGAWMDHLQAPSKKTIWLENSAHLGMIEEPGKVFAVLLRDVLPLTEKD